MRSLFGGPVATPVVAATTVASTVHVNAGLYETPWGSFGGSLHASTMASQRPSHRRPSDEAYLGPRGPPYERSPGSTDSLSGFDDGQVVEAPARGVAPPSWNSLQNSFKRTPSSCDSLASDDLRDIRRLGESRMHLPLGNPVRIEPPVREDEDEGDRPEAKPGS